MNIYVKNFPVIFDFADNTIACFKKYSTFQGKASRKEFWYFYLFTVIVSVLTYLIDVSIFRKDPDGILFINTFFAMITFLPSLAAGCRRLHDVNKLVAINFNYCDWYNTFNYMAGIKACKRKK